MDPKPVNNGWKSWVIGALSGLLLGGGVGGGAGVIAARAAEERLNARIDRLETRMVREIQLIRQGR